MPDNHPNAVRREQVAEFLGPFHQADTVVIKVVLNADIKDFPGGIQPVEIHVAQKVLSTVFIDEGECRARNLILNTERPRYSTGENCFPGTEFSGKCYNITWFQRSGKLNCVF